MRSHIALALIVPVLAGCAGGYATKPAKNAKAPPAPTAEVAPATYTRPCTDAPSDRDAFECDRRSILAMAGEYKVKFAFDETAALAPGYAPKAAQRSGGTELVLVIDDSPEHISLQHILVLGEKHAIVKHWRQDWQYQPAQILRFQGNGRFQSEAVPEAARHGAWSQTVYEVDDAPRYAGIGRWRHAQGEDSWESDLTLRPLPRREYTKRSDYQALSVINRHALTPGGWIHEQDNTKLVIDADGKRHALAREQGLNTYTHIADYDFSAGRDYWKKTSSFWADTRREWLNFEQAHPRFTTSPEPNGEPRIEAVFNLAEKVEKGGTADPSEVRALIEKYVSATK